MRGSLGPLSQAIRLIPPPPPIPTPPHPAEGSSGRRLEGDSHTAASLHPGREGPRTPPGSKGSDGKPGEDTGLRGWPKGTGHPCWAALSSLRPASLRSCPALGAGLLRGHRTFFPDIIQLLGCSQWPRTAKEGVPFPAHNLPSLGMGD